MSIIKKCTAFLLLAAMLFNPILIANAQETDLSLVAVQEFFSALAEHRVSDIGNMLAYEDRADFQEFIFNPYNDEENIGYYNYADVEIISCTKIESDEVNLADISAAKVAAYSEWACWDCIVNVTAYRESDYLTSGINRFFIYTAYDDSGNCLIMETYRISGYNSPNSSMMTRSYDAPVANPCVWDWANPTAIRVEGYGLVDFRMYCYVVTANEFGTNSYNQEARKAVAMAIKQYGWNRRLVQKYPSYEYDVKATTNDQVYNPTKQVTDLVMDAVDDIWEYVMLTCDKKLFCGFHVANSNINSHAVQGGGILSQMGAHNLGQNGYGWQDILHYYYDYGTYNMEMTQGTIIILPFDHEVVGNVTKTAVTNIYHYYNCVVCGCVHGGEWHRWEKIVGGEKCTICGVSTTDDSIVVWSMGGYDE